MKKRPLQQLRLSGAQITHPHQPQDAVVRVTDYAGDSVLFLDTTSGLDSIPSMKSLGEYEKRSGPRSAITAAVLQTSEQPKYISVRDVGRVISLDAREISPFGASQQSKRTLLRCRILAWRLHLYENAAEIPAPTNTTSSHQPNTTAMQVPRLTLVRHEKAMPVSTIVHMVKRSTEVATE